MALPTVTKGAAKGAVDGLEQGIRWLPNCGPNRRSFRSGFSGFRPLRAGEIFTRRSAGQKAEGYPPAQRLSRAQRLSPEVIPPAQRLSRKGYPGTDRRRIGGADRRIIPDHPGSSRDGTADGIIPGRNGAADGTADGRMGGSAGRVRDGSAAGRVCRRARLKRNHAAVWPIGLGDSA